MCCLFSVMTVLPFEVIAPGIRPSVVQIVQVALVGIGLTLKRDIAVSIAAHGQPHEPLHEIGQIKEHEQHLALLGRVNAFMVHQLMAQIYPRMHKKHTQQVDGRVASKGQYGRADDFHRGKVTIFFVYHPLPSPLRRFVHEDFLVVFDRKRAKIAFYRLLLQRF